MKEQHRKIFVNSFATMIVGVFAASTIIPFIWMISASFKIPSDVLKIPIDWIPDYWYPKNYLIVWNFGEHALRDYHFALSYWNSIKVSFINLAGAVFTSTMAGYAFAKIKFRGANAIFLIYLSAMMIPSQVTLIPRFVLFDKLGLMGTHWSLILPGIVTITGTFLMRQYFMQIPNELRESAQIDGASEFKIFTKIMIHLAGPAMASLSIVVFLWNWNDYINPLIFLRNWRTYTIPVSLSNFIDENVTEYNLIMAASVSALVPVFIVFVIGQRYFIKGLTAGAVKG